MHFSRLSVLNMPHQYTYTDDELLLKVSAGNEQAFRTLFAIYHQQLGAFIYRLTHSMELAEEIVQDVFLKIWLNRETIDGVQNFKAYLFIVSRNHALNCLRKIAREHAQKVQMEQQLSEELERQHEHNPYYSILDEAIDNLPPQQQKVYLLSRHQRLKYSEIAEELNLSHETVKKYLQIATSSITEYVHANIEFSILLIAFLFF